MLDQLDAARRRHLMLEQKMAALEAGHTDEIRRVHAQTRNDLEALHNRIGVVESSAPSHRQIMQAVRTAIDAAGAAGTTEERYAQLCEIPHAELTPEELAALKLHELVAPLVRQCDAQARQIVRISEAGAALEQALGHASAEAERLAAAKATAEAALARIRSEDSRVARMDELERKRAEAVEDAARSRALLAELEGRVAMYNDARAEAETAAIDARRRLEVAQLDKEHLTRANADLHAAKDSALSQLREQQVATRKLEQSREEA